MSAAAPKSQSKFSQSVSQYCYLELWVPGAAVDCLHMASQHFQRLAVLYSEHLKHAAGRMKQYMAVIGHRKLPCLHKQLSHQQKRDATHS